MSAELAPTSTAGQDDTTPPDRAPRLLKWPWRTASGAVTALGTSTLLYPRGTQPAVVVLGVDGYGWSFLFGVTTALLTAVFLIGAMHLITRDRRSWWADLLATLIAIVLLTGVGLGFPIAWIGGALSFKNNYREVGTVDGHTIVIEQFVGWRGADSVYAGYRTGPLVSFNSETDSYLQRTFTDIHSWRFELTTTATTVAVHYRSNDHPSQTGTLTLPRASPKSAQPSARRFRPSPPVSLACT